MIEDGRHTTIPQDHPLPVEIIQTVSPLSITYYIRQRCSDKALISLQGAYTP